LLAPRRCEERSERDHTAFKPIGPTTDPKAIAYKIAEINGSTTSSLAFDRWRINDLKRELDAIGCHAPLEPHGQGYKDMSPAVDIVERLVIQRKLRHGAHPARCRYGYARISTRDQDLASQDAELRAAGCAKVFKEKVSGARSDRPELAKLLRRMEPSDVLVVTRLDRLARSTRDLLNTLDAIAEAEASLVAG
jgi:hypothetical protein